MATFWNSRGQMKRLALIMAMVTAMLSPAQNKAITAQVAGQGAPIQDMPPVASFKSGVDLVRVSAVVRDRKGRFVRDLTRSDFHVLDDGQMRQITDFRHDVAGISITLLFDVSGSMEARLANAREAASHLLGWIDKDRDEAAVFTFDTRLVQLTPFTRGLQALPPELDLMTPFGATGLHDAIAQTAERLEGREGRRRAVVVLTDGKDNASRLTPSEVSGVASAIDVPVYVIGLVPSIDNPGAENAVTSTNGSALVGSLGDLAEWTGGHSFMASTPGERSAVARQIVDELRHQYLLAFESSGKPGWHPLVVRARDKDLTVRARSGYFAGQSRPNSH
jgi:Ca-activated chloride channel family protein